MDFQKEEIIQLVPKRIGRLAELANNLWWSWDEDGRQVFRSLDYELWRASGHNPVKQLRDINPDKLEAAAKDPAFLELYDSVISKFDNYMLSKKDWCGKKVPDNFEGQIAYFSAEYAIHNSLPIYAGGLRSFSRRHLQAILRHRIAVGCRGIHVSSRLFPPTHLSRRLARRSLHTD